MADVKVTKDTENKALIVEAVVNAPKEKVWSLYADRASFEKWWGPEGWQTTVKEFDFRPGGRIHYDMHCIDTNQGEWYDQHAWGIMDIENINEGTSFAYQDAFSDESGSVNPELPTMQCTNELVEEGGKTRIISTIIAKTAEQLEEVLKMGIEEGWSSQLDKLDALLVE